MVHGGAAYHRPNSIAGGFRLAQSLKDHDSAALTPNVPIRRRIERLALPIGRKHHRIGPQLVDATVQNRLHAAGDSQVCLALLQVCHRVVDRDHG